MVGAPGGQGGRFSPKRAADFLKPQEIPVECERAIQVFHIKHHMPQVLRLHWYLPNPLPGTISTQLQPSPAPNLKLTYLVALQRGSLPPAEACSRFVGALQESQQDRVRRCCGSYRLIGQHNLS